MRHQGSEVEAILARRHQGTLRDLAAPRSSAGGGPLRLTRAWNPGLARHHAYLRLGDRVVGEGYGATADDALRTALADALEPDRPG